MIKIVCISLSLVSALLAYKYFKPVDILNLAIPHKGYTVYYDKAYGRDQRQRLDIYVPDKLSSPATTLIYFYGGSWQVGDKNMYRFLGQAFASKGFITVVVNYRMYPDVYFPSFMQDGAKAVRWVHDNIQKYKGDNNHMFLVGHSAGAHIAALLTTNEDYIKAEDGKTSWIKGVIGLAGPYDFLPFTDPKIKALFSKEDNFKTQPIHYVKPGLPPFFLATGDEDTTVRPKNTVNLAKRLRESNVAVTEIIYPHVAHIGIILSLASGFRFKAPLLEDITRFIKTENQQKPSS